MKETKNKTIRIRTNLCPMVNKLSSRLEIKKNTQLYIVHYTLYIWCVFVSNCLTLGAFFSFSGINFNIFTFSGFYFFLLYFIALESYVFAAFNSLFAFSVYQTKKCCDVMTKYTVFSHTYSEIYNT